MSLANIEPFSGKEKIPAVLKRMEVLATDASSLRARLQRLQTRIDGGALPDDAPGANIPMGGLKANLDHIENDMRALTRTMNALEELL